MEDFKRSVAALPASLKTKAAAKRVLEAQLALIEAGVPGGDLARHAEFLSPASYAEITLERNTLGLCGYPQCAGAYNPATVGVR